MINVKLIMFVSFMKEKTMENNEKFVEFDKYCKNCQYADLPEEKDPCDECLTNPTNTNTTQPVMFKEK